MEFKNIENPKKLVYCHFCEREITRATYISDDASHVEICPKCFLEGKESENHKKISPYRVIQKLDFSILEEGWTAHEELVFLEALELYGYGNWEDIACYMNSKTAVAIEKHFKSCYGRFLDQPLSIDEKREIIKNSPLDSFETILDKKNRILANQIEITRKEAEKHNIHAGKASIYGDILGFMPLRREFDFEYDNDAELLLAEMEFAEDESDNDIKTKYSVLEIYNRKLEERQKRKNFVIDREKLDIKKRFEMEKMMSTEEREIRNGLKAYERFLEPAEFEELVECILKEQEYKRNIEKLLSLKNVGYTNFAELEGLVFENGDHFSAEHKLHIKDEEINTSKKRRGNINYSDVNKIDIANLCISNPTDQVYDIVDENDNMLIEEVNLCNRYEISYQNYLILKEFIVRECIQNGFVDRSHIKGAVTIDGKKVDAVFDCLKRRNVILEKSNN